MLYLIIFLILFWLFINQKERMANTLKFIDPKVLKATQIKNAKKTAERILNPQNPQKLYLTTNELCRAECVMDDKCYAYAVVCNGSQSTGLENIPGSVTRDEVSPYYAAPKSKQNCPGSKICNLAIVDENYNPMIRNNAIGWYWYNKNKA